MIHTFSYNISVRATLYSLLILSSMQTQFMCAMDRYTNTTDPFKWDDDLPSSSANGASTSLSTITTANTTTTPNTDNVPAGKIIPILRITGGESIDVIYAFHKNNFQHMQELSLSGVKDLSSWASVQKILDAAPQLNILVLHRNPLQGTCTLLHQNLKELHVEFTDTSALRYISLPKATVIDFSNNLLQKVNTISIKCENGARLIFGGNPHLQEMSDIEDIKNRCLCVDLSNTPIRVDSVMKQICMSSYVGSVFTSFMQNMVKDGIKSLHLITNAGMSIVWLLWPRDFSEYHIKVFKWSIGLCVATTVLKACAKTYETVLPYTGPALLVRCDDGDFYADNTIQKKQFLVSNTKAWYLTDKKQ